MPTLRSGIKLGVGIAVSLVVMAALLPTAIEDVAGTDTSNWTSLAVTFWDLTQFGIALVPLLFALAWAMDLI